MRPVLLVSLAIALSVATAVRAAPQSLGEQAEVQPSCPSAGAVSASFVAAVSAASFRTSDGKEIRLAGVVGSGEDSEPSLPEEVLAARAALGLALSGHQLSLAIIGAPDRYQRSLRMYSLTVSGFRTPCFARDCYGWGRTDRPVAARQRC
jgi:hypothetical protein